MTAVSFLRIYIINPTVNSPTMFKGISGSPDLARLFKTTKIAQLQNKMGDLTLNANGAFPTHQIIEAPASSFSRRDFGLKMRIPKKIKTRRIIVNDLDNKYGLPDFEPLNGHYFRKLRFKEFGIPVKTRDSSSFASSTPSHNTLFPSSAENATVNTLSAALGIPVQSLKSKDFQKIVAPRLKELRRPFMKWLALKYPERLLNADLYQELIEFVKETQPKLQFSSDPNAIPSTYANKLSGTAGLGYNLQGRLFQTPNGPQLAKVQESRSLGQKRIDYNFAVGGFVGSGNASQAQYKFLDQLMSQHTPVRGDKFAREFKIPITVDNATIDLDKKRLSVRVTPVSVLKTFKSNRSSISSTSNSLSAKNHIPGSDKDTGVVLGNLLSLLGDVSKKRKSPK